MTSEPTTKKKMTGSIDGIIASRTPLAQTQSTHLRVRPHLGKRTVQICIGVFVAAAVAGMVVVLALRGSDSLPTTVVSRAGFPLYYPSPAPLGYEYQKGSIKVAGGIVTYRLSNGPGIVTVSEQAAPPDPPILTRLAGFTGLSTDAGNAALGTAATKQPVAIIVSNTTLITITGQVNMPSDTIAKLAQAMSSLPQK